MEYTSTGDMRISRICMGCWNISGGAIWGPQNEEDTVATIKAALDTGINFFDTAEAYGRGYSEEILGKTLGSRRNEIIIATKTARVSVAEITESCEASLKRLQTNYIDIYYIHWPDWDIPLEETVKAVEKLKNEGKIRMLAVSNFGRTDIESIKSLCDIKINQLAYNLLFRAIEYEILPTCVGKGIGVGCYSPLAEALLTGKFSGADEVPAGRARTRHFSGQREMARHGEGGEEKLTFETIKLIRGVSEKISIPMPELSMAWLLAQEGVSFVIAGARRPDQIIQNSRAAGIKLAPDIIEELNSITLPLKEKMGTNPDMWQSVPRIR